MGFFFMFNDTSLVSEVFFPFMCWAVLSMITSDNVVEDALRTSAADSAVGIQRRHSWWSVEHVHGEAKSSCRAGARAGYAPTCRGS